MGIEDAKTLDLINRDPNGLNESIQVMFDDVLAEPEDIHSPDCIWSGAKKCFDCGLKRWYHILTYCCGICTALYWGCVFADVAFFAIWFISPFMRALSICLHPIKKVISILLTSFAGPCMSTIGMMLSRIHVVTSQGDPPAPLGEL